MRCVLCMKSTEMVSLIPPHPALPLVTVCLTPTIVCGNYCDPMGTMVTMWHWYVTLVWLSHCNSFVAGITIYKHGLGKAGHSETQLYILTSTVLFWHSPTQLILSDNEIALLGFYRTWPLLTLTLALLLLSCFFLRSVLLAHFRDTHQNPKPR